MVNPLFPAVPKLLDGILNDCFNKEVGTMGSFDVTKSLHCKTFDVFIKKLKLYGVLAYHEIYSRGRKRLNRCWLVFLKGRFWDGFLFLVAINDLPFNIHIYLVLYA